MKFDVAYCYNKQYVPYRLPQARTRMLRETIEVDIPSATSKEAPIAFTHKDCWFPQMRVFRWFNGNLYTRETKRPAKETGWETLADLRQWLSDGYISRLEVQDDEETGRQYAIKKANRYLILNKREVWVKTGEPRYVIATFGLGGNHAETALMIDHRCNHNIAGSRYFNALQRDEAVEEAVRVALARGDTKSVPAIKRSWKITVKIPEAVRCDPPSETGPGDPFLNALDAVTTVKNPLAAGLLAIGMATKEVGE